jgi:hypothetical protein
MNRRGSGFIQFTEELSWVFGPPEQMESYLVTPAQAGVHVRKDWIPAFAGMT